MSREMKAAIKAKDMTLNKDDFFILSISRPIFLMKSLKTNFLFACSYSIRHVNSMSTCKILIFDCLTNVIIKKGQTHSERNIRAGSDPFFIMASLA